MASIMTDKGRLVAWNGDYPLDSSSFKGVLLKSTYTPSKDHDFIDDISTYECDATGYTGGFGGGGRHALANPTVSLVATNLVKWDADNPAQWANLGGATNNTLRYMAVVIEVTNDAASPVLAILDLQQDYNTNGGNFDVAIATAGIATNA